MKKVGCPFCDFKGAMSTKTSKEEAYIEGSEIEYTKEYYECPECEEGFSTEQQIDATLAEIKKEWMHD